MALGSTGERGEGDGGCDSSRGRKVAEEERLAEVERWAEVEHCWRAEEAERQQVLEECHQQVEVEQRGSSVEVAAGLNKKRKIQETVSDKLSEEKSTNTTNRERWSKWGV